MSSLTTRPAVRRGCSRSSLISHHALILRTTSNPACCQLRPFAAAAAERQEIMISTAGARHAVPSFARPRENGVGLLEASRPMQAKRPSSHTISSRRPALRWATHPKAQVGIRSLPRRLPALGERHCLALASV